jgi:hypothetical protein
MSVLNACAKQNPTDPIKSGSEGVQIMFLETIPKEVVVGNENQPLQLAVDVRNRGAYPETTENSEWAGMLWISGYDKNAITIDPQSVSLTPIEGRNPCKPNWRRGSC